MQTIPPSRDNPLCVKCGLFEGCKHPFMKSYGATDPIIMVIGEAPGEEEDAADRPFVGRSGQLLREVLSEVGIDVEKDARFTNVVRCRPPDNKISKKHITYCSMHALDDIKKYDPKVVLLMGNSPLQGILNQTGITNWHGVHIVKNLVGKDMTFIPLYHPAYILRDNSHTGEWVDAMNGIGIVDKPESYELVYPRTVAEVFEMREFLSQHKWISFDTEVSVLDPFTDASLLLAVSFAAGGKAYSVPLDHPEAWWDIGNGTHKQASDYDTVFQTVIDVLTEHNNYIIGHNVKFDLVQAYQLLGVDLNAGGDTMLISHILDSRQGIHGLKRLAGLHLGMYEYDSEIETYRKEHKEADYAKGGSMAFVPLEIMLPYSAKDAEATYRLHELLYEKLSKKQVILYRQLVMRISNVLTRMQINGIAIDYYIAKRYATLYGMVRDDALKAIHSDKKVLKLEQANGKIFNPGSSTQLGELLFDRKYYGLTPTELTAGGKPSTSSKSLKGYIESYPIVGQIRQYKLLSKMIGTYLEPCATGEWSSGDGRVRTTYNLHGTRTGRLSSSQPVNLQNIPTPEKEPGTILETLPVKNIFTHSWGYKKNKPLGGLISIDYSGMELRIFASLAKCYPMIEIHKSSKDFHSVVAIMSMTHKTPADITMEEIAALPKPLRYRYKWTNWTLLYGGDAHTLHRMYGVPLEDAEETVHMYYDMFPEVLDYKETCTEFAKIHGYIESPFGRREHLPYINDRDIRKSATDARAAVNMPVQSGASDTLLCALIVIDTEMRRRGMKSMLVNTVHDSILIDAPLEEVDDVSELAVDIMEHITLWATSYLPKIDFSWLISPLKADVEIGTHYGIETDIQEWKAKYDYR